MSSVYNDKVIQAMAVRVSGQGGQRPVFFIPPSVVLTGQK